MNGLKNFIILKLISEMKINKKNSKFFLSLPSLNAGLDVWVMIIYLYPKCHQDHGILLHVICFCGGYIKDLVSVPPFPKTLKGVKEHFSATLKTIHSVKLQNEWNGLGYRIDVCRVHSSNICN